MNVWIEVRARVLHPIAWARWYWHKATVWLWCSSCRESISGYCWANGEFQP